MCSGSYERHRRNAGDVFCHVRREARARNAVGKLNRSRRLNAPRTISDFQTVFIFLNFALSTGEVTMS
jgi:hypothetical protein